MYVFHALTRSSKPKSRDNQLKYPKRFFLQIFGSRIFFPLLVPRQNSFSFFIPPDKKTLHINFHKTRFVLRGGILYFV
jgi:hypothetical protein